MNEEKDTHAHIKYIHFDDFHLHLTAHTYYRHITKCKKNFAAAEEKAKEEKFLNVVNSSFFPQQYLSLIYPPSHLFFFLSLSLNERSCFAFISHRHRLFLTVVVVMFSMLSLYAIRWYLQVCYLPSLFTRLKSSSPSLAVCFLLCLQLLFLLLLSSRLHVCAENFTLMSFAVILLLMLLSLAHFFFCLCWMRRDLWETSRASIWLNVKLLNRQIRVAILF